MLVRTSVNNVIVSPCLIIDNKHVNKIIAALDAGLTAAARAGGR